MDFLYKIFLTFIIYSFLGWILEVVYHIYTMKKFVNRGFLHGPICPIYGTGAVIIITFLQHLKGNTIYIFIGGAIFASLLEYITGYILELVFHTKWWDYSDRPLNLNGYITLSFSIYWGIASVIMMKYIHPVVLDIIDKIPGTWISPLAILLFILFIGDVIITIKSLVEFRKVLYELVDLRRNIEEKVEDEGVLMSGKLKRITSKLKHRHRRFLRSYPTISTQKIRTKIKEYMDGI